MTKNSIIATLSVALIGTSSAAAYFAFGLHHTYAGRLTKPHFLNECNDFIHNYNTGRIPPPFGAQTGWLVNIDELRPFIRKGTYLHLSLARQTPDTPYVTLVVSAVDKNYNHAFPKMTNPASGKREAYALESVHPCPPCNDEAHNPAGSVYYKLKEGGDHQP